MEHDPIGNLGIVEQLILNASVVNFALSRRHSLILVILEKVGVAPVVI